VKSLHGGSYSIIPDQIEAGTFMAAVAAAGGEVRINNIIPKHMDCITAKLVEMGVQVEEDGDALIVRREGKLTRTNVKTMPYPGFPTDMHPQFSALLALAQGVSKVSEGIFSTRFKYAAELNKMGANVEVIDSTAIINGVDSLHGADVKATDLRAGACLVIAGLAANGVTTVSNVEFIDRGYENLIEKLKRLGADIKRI
jgi:UDP-N-acetylglucosamine 1-carboxyvinyltransferase